MEPVRATQRLAGSGETEYKTARMGGQTCCDFCFFFYRENGCEKVNASLCFLAAGKRVSGPPLQLPAGVRLNSRWCLQVGEAAGGTGQALERRHALLAATAALSARPPRSCSGPRLLTLPVDKCVLTGRGCLPTIPMISYSCFGFHAKRKKRERERERKRLRVADCRPT